MKRIGSFLLAATTALVLWGCVQAENREPTGMQPIVFMQQLNAVRQKQAEAPAKDVETLLDFPSNQEAGIPPFTPEEIQRVLSAKPQENVTNAQAREDVEMGFRMLQECYGGYYYFGGDDAFGKAKEQVLQQIGQVETISARNLATAITDSLHFVQDGHMTVGGQRVLARSVNRFCKELFAYPTQKGWEVELDGQWWQVLGEWEEYWKPTIGPDGQLCYTLATRALIGTQLPQSMELISSTERRVLPLQWEEGKMTREKGLPLYQRTEQDGVPIYTIRSMAGEQSLLNAFAESGKEARQHPLIVVDLRGNSGGSDQYPNTWFENFTGQPPAFPAVSRERPTALSIQLMLDTYPEYWDFYSKMAAESTMGAWICETSQGQWRENETIVLCLVDSHVASSGESMMRCLSTMSNVIFIGSNSSGCSIVGNVCNKRLPNSGIPLYFGQAMWLTDNFQNKDGIGYAPDLWVAPDQALERALALAKRLQ